MASLYTAEGDSRYSTEDCEELLRVASLKWDAMEIKMASHFTEAAMNPEHPIGRVCVPFAQEVRAKILHGEGGLTQGTLDALSTQVHLCVIHVCVLLLCVVVVLDLCFRFCDSVCFGVCVVVICASVCFGVCVVVMYPAMFSLRVYPAHT